jgi:hypothetical protein
MREIGIGGCEEEDDSDVMYTTFILGIRFKVSKFDMGGYEFKDCDTTSKFVQLQAF